MDYMLTNIKCEKDEMFDPKLNKYSSDFMLENWSPDSMDLMDSIFDTDLLNFDGIDDFSTDIKMESKEFEPYAKDNSLIFNKDISVNDLFENTSSCVVEPSISSNSSDSGLSSDNLDMDASPEYEPLSPAISSPGPSISERGEKNSPASDAFSTSSSSTSPTYLEHLFLTDTNKTFEAKKVTAKKTTSSTSIKLSPPSTSSKVVVEKIPKIINLPTKRTLSQSLETNNNNHASGKKEKEIKIIKLTPQSFKSSNGKKVTIQVKNNSNNGTKSQVKSGTILINNKGKIAEVKKLIPVQTTSNPRSILLPVTFQDVKGMKAYKVLNMSSLKNFNNTNKNPTYLSTVKPVQENTKIIKLEPELPEESIPQNISDIDSLILEDFENDETEELIEECEDIDEYEKVTDDSDLPYPKLILSAEEKRLLAKEGITLPSHYPLTKYEERELKRIRRKIRNKISAQDSRKRKKEYVDGLEERVKQCTEENQTLIKKIKLLQTQNQNLMSQMKKLQSLLSKGTNKTAHPTTCLLVLLLSLALVATPNLKFGQNAKENELNEFAQDTAAILQNRRNLLFDVKENNNNNNNDVIDEDFNINDFIAMNDITSNAGLNEFIMNHCKKMNDSNMEPPVCKKIKNIIDFDVDDTNWYLEQEQQKSQQQQQQKQNSIYDLAAEIYQKNKSQQTSGFNIKNSYDDILDKNVLEILPKQRLSNGLYELNIEKIDTNAGQTLNINTNISE